MAKISGSGKAKRKTEHLTIEGREISLSNLEKVLYPEGGFTKARVIDFYIRIAPVLLPHFKNRPVTLKRYPDGVRGEFFYEKDAPSFAPEWIETFPVPRRAGGPDIRYILINDLATLVWCANAASLELHPFLHRVPRIEEPTSVVFDLDPGEDADLVTCAETAFLLREVLLSLGLQSFPKVSGSKGIQVYVPLNGDVTYAVTQPFAKGIAELLAKEYPKLIVALMPKHLRKRKVFIDWSQNADFKTTVGVYSLRAKRSRPFVSVPVSWDELALVLKSRDADAVFFDPEAALTRVADVGDLFTSVLTLKQSLPSKVVRAIPAARTGSRSRRLTEYERKRDFGKTSEPEATSVGPSAQGSRKRFVVQQHAARHMHYDFRLEMHGVLKSWAVPKGVPYDINDRRLAMATEDHPLEYLEFEGVIPEGQYGGGTVIVWDIGTYELIEGNYYKGDVRIHLAGKKLRGEWRMTKDAKRGATHWLLTKSGKSLRPPGKRTELRSALTGRTLEAIASDGNAIWHSNRTSVPGIDLDTLPKSDLQFTPPMLAKAVEQLPEGQAWQYEIKLDGYRALGMKDRGSVRLLSRRNNAMNDKFPEIVSTLASVEDGVLVDGEIVALDAEGRPDFNLLQHHRENRKAIVYYLFDVLAYRGRDTRNLPLRDRQALLGEIMQRAAEPIRRSHVFEADAAELIEAVRQQGLEGIVAKRRESRYESGERSGNWVKYRVNKGQELVIGGYRVGKTYFDNLAVGYYDDAGKLIFIAKVKNGFTPDVKRQVFERFRGLESKGCPFANLPEAKSARRGEALTKEAMNNYRWLKPELVAEIGFTDWTAADHLRHSRFIGLREDKDAREVVKEDGTR